MSDEREGLFLQLGALEAELLHRAAAASGRTKHELVEDAVRGHLDRKEMRHEPASDVLSADEAAAVLRIDVDALVAGTQAGDIPGRLIGREWRFSKAALLRWLGE